MLYCCKPNLKGGWLNFSRLSGRPEALAANFSLDGGMISRSAERAVDERSEPRQPASSSTAMLDFRGRKHVVRLVNVSMSGAMVIFPHTPNIGEEVGLHLLDRGLLTAHVIWVKEGRIGVSFAAPTE